MTGGHLIPKPKKTQNGQQLVFTLLVQVGRSRMIGLPKKASGAAANCCYASGVDEPRPVARKTVRDPESKRSSRPLGCHRLRTLERTARAGPRRLATRTASYGPRP